MLSHTEPNYRLCSEKNKSFVYGFVITKFLYYCTDTGLVTNCTSRMDTGQFYSLRSIQKCAVGLSRADVNPIVDSVISLHFVPIFYYTISSMLNF